MDKAKDLGASKEFGRELGGAQQSGEDTFESSFNFSFNSSMRIAKAKQQARLCGVEETTLEFCPSLAVNSVPLPADIGSSLQKFQKFNIPVFDNWVTRPPSVSAGWLAIGEDSVAKFLRLGRDSPSAVLASVQLEPWPMNMTLKAFQ